MSRKWFMVLVIVAAVGLAVAVTVRLSMPGILPFNASNNQPSIAPSAEFVSRGQSKMNSTAAEQRPATESMPSQTTLDPDQPSINQESPPPELVQIPINFSTFENPIYGIFIKYPSNWQVEEEDNDNDGTIDIAGFLSPFEDRFDTYKERLWLSLDTLPSPNITLNEYSQGVIKHNNNTLQDFRLLDNDIDSFILAGYPAYRHVNEWALEDGTVIKQMEIGTKVGDKVYYVDYYAEQDKYDSFLPVIQEIIDSFKIWA